MSSSEKGVRTNSEAESVALLTNFLSPRADEVIILGQVTKYRTQKSHFGVTLIKQRYKGDTLHDVGSHVATENQLNTASEQLKVILGLNIIRPDEKERLGLVRKKILEITKEAKSKIKKTT